MANRLIKKVISGAVLNITNLVVQAVLGLFVFKEIFTFFGEQDFGRWTVIYALLAHISLFEFGLGMVITRQISLAEYCAEKRKRKLSTAFYMLLSVAMIFLLLFVLCAVLYHLTDNNQYFSDGTSILLVASLLALNFFLGFISGGIQAFLIGEFKVKTVNIIRFIVNLYRALGVIGGLHLGFGIIGVASVFFSSSLIELLCRYYFAVKIKFKTEISFAQVDLGAFKYIKERGMRFVFLSINDYVRHNAGILLTSLLMSAVVVVPLRISGRLMEIFSQVLGSVNLLLTPYFSKFITSDNNNFNRKFEISLVISSLISLTIYFNILAHGEWFLNIWLGSYPEVTLDALFILAIGFAVANMQSPVNSVLLAKDHYKTLSYLSLAECVLTLAMMLVFISQFGVIGAAYALSISLLLIRGILQPILVCRVLSISIYRYIAPSLAVALLLLVFFKGIQWGAEVIEKSYSLGYVFSYLALEMLIFAILSSLLYIKLIRLKAV